MLPIKSLDHFINSTVNTMNVGNDNQSAISSKIGADTGHLLCINRDLQPEAPRTPETAADVENVFDSESALKRLLDKFSARQGRLAAQLEAAAESGTAAAAVANEMLDARAQNNERVAAIAGQGDIPDVIIPTVGFVSPIEMRSAVSSRSNHFGMLNPIPINPALRQDTNIYSEGDVNGDDEDKTIANSEALL